MIDHRRKPVVSIRSEPLRYHRQRAVVSSRMKHRVFLDTNVFVYAFEFEDSNSRVIIEMLNDGELEVVVSGRVLREVMRYFKRFHGRALSGMFRDYILQSCTVVFADDIRAVMKRYKGKIKDKDLEQLAATKALGLRSLVSYDRHFEPFEEYITPRAFVETVGRKGRTGEF